MARHSWWKQGAGKHGNRAIRRQQMAMRILLTVLHLRQIAMEKHDYGPYVLVVSSMFERLLGRLYFPFRVPDGRPNTLTVRQRLLEVSGVESITVRATSGRIILQDIHSQRRYHNVGLVKN